jgi:hypothetical protein
MGQGADYLYNSTTEQTLEIFYKAWPTGAIRTKKNYVVYEGKLEYVGANRLTNKIIKEFDDFDECMTYCGVDWSEYEIR